MFNKGDRVEIIADSISFARHHDYVWTTGVVMEDLGTEIKVKTYDGKESIFNSLELLKEEHMILQEKIKRLISGTAALHTPTQEIYDKLAIELEKHGYTWGVEIYSSFWKHYAEGTYVGYSYGTLDYGDKSAYQDEKCDILELTLADFPEITQVTIIGDTTVQMKAKVTKGDNGYTVEKLVEPKFAVGEIVVTRKGQAVKIIEINDSHYKFQWYNGIVHEQPFEVVEGNFKRFPW